MKITYGPQNYIQSPDAVKKKPATQAAQKAQQTGKQAGGAFDVQFSKAVELISTPAAEDDQIRTAKVESIRKQLASGTYNISGRDVAEKILNALKG